MTIENLQRELDVHYQNLDETIEAVQAAIKLEPVDTSEWKEFGSFFRAPLSRDLFYQWNATYPAYRDGVRHVARACFLSVTSASKEKAIEALRADLLKLRNTQSVEVVAFLATPSTIELKAPIVGDEVADSRVIVDLRPEGVPAKKLWAAFCFLHAVEVVDRYYDYSAPEQSFYKAVDKKRLEELLLEHACHEGEIGKRVT